MDFFRTRATGCLSCSVKGNLANEPSRLLFFSLNSKSSGAPLEIEILPPHNFFIEVNAHVRKVFHYVQAWMRSSSTAVLDVCAYDTMDGVLGQYFLGNLADLSNRQTRDTMPLCMRRYLCDAVRRIEVDLSKPKLLRVYDLPLRDGVGNTYRVKLASVSPAYVGKEACYAYAISYHALGSMRYEDMGMSKIDLCKAAKVATGKLGPGEDATTVQVWHEENVYVGEPLFVPNPQERGEDAGLVFVGLCCGARWRAECLPPAMAGRHHLETGWVVPGALSPHVRVPRRESMGNNVNNIGMFHSAFADLLYYTIMPDLSPQGKPYGRNRPPPLPKDCSLQF
eukprot:g50402.t1